MKVIRKSIALLLAAAIVFTSLSLIAMAANSKKKSSEFIHTSGQKAPFWQTSKDAKTV